MKRTTADSLLAPAAGAQYACGCPGNAQAISIAANSPAWLGNAGFGLTVGANPFLPAFVAVDVVQQAWPFGQCWAFVNIASSTVVILPVQGNVTIPAPLIGIPAGQTLFVQAAMTCIGQFGSVLGYCYSVSPAYQIKVALP